MSHTASPAVPATEIAGIGCPDGAAQDVTLDAAATGPGWIAAGGGWTGNGCDGSSAWTVATPVNLTSPASLTWSFHPAAGTSQCDLSIYVPTQNALGTGEYAISTSSGPLATVQVDQPASSGLWITLGTYQVAGPAMTITFMPRAYTLAAALTLPGWPTPGTLPLSGIDGGSPVAASAAQATCS
jgi:hypothetical protein